MAKVASSPCLHLPVTGRTARAWRSTPLIWKPIPILLGAGVLLLVQARRNYLADQEARRSKVVDGEGRIVSMSGPWTVYVLGALPLNAISRAWGWANNITLPVWFRPFGFRLYSRIFGCNLDEMQDPDLTHYKSLGEFFYRELKEGVRTIEEAPVVSPADGTVLHFGTIQGRRVEQVKGITYSLDALLGTSSEPQARDDFVGGLSQDGQGQSSDERRFADINGIAYSLDRLLGNEQLDADGKRRKSRWIFGPLASLTWSSETNAQTARAPLADRPEQIPSRREDGESFNGSPFTLSGPEEEAGIPTSDTPEILGRYANVAYEMGGGALPPILQRHSPGHDGIAQGNKLFFAVIYLAPGDYHHFHSPTAWVVERRRHFRGELYSVSPYVASRLSNLFVLNERVAMLGRWRHGFFGMIPVGATNVGSIVVSFDKALRTNVRDQRALAGTYSEASYSSASRLLGGQPLLPGQEMGGFRLGSTVVLVFEAPEEFAFTITPGQKIKLGAALGDFTPR
ncbi:Phosphatidylserine decarboxylase [Ceraceosorus bombacis]|uniref:Phosphatidylserine decarboxylase proenzyme 1, mitochondrial n=1 Tax=Ceraceosorus bombacis TaxID=401625 RepID=A0A0P1BQ02_9BASI|nr:Phosphatidylserine decarboxylase [Ceraceosorus bombacis]